MKLSTRALYGLRAMLVIAQEATHNPVMVKEIAARQRLPATYLEQVMVPLRKSGLVTATRGARGGYRLPRPASGITLYEILEVLEGPLVLVDCTDIPHCCQQPEMCAVKDILDDASRALTDSLKRITLDDLVERQNLKGSVSVLDYVI